MQVSRLSVLHLYKNLLYESSKFTNYNFRSYCLRRIRDMFRMNRYLTDSSEVEGAYKMGLEQLEIIKRQVIVGGLYKSEKLVIEKEQNMNK